MNDFYRSYLDADPHREGTGAAKWDGRMDMFGRADVVPMWVADMDFPTAPAVVDALVKRAQHPIYGYHCIDPRQSEVNWMRRRHGLQLEKDWIMYVPGVIDGMAFVFQALTEPGESILIQPPVYGPFRSTTEQQGRTVRFSPLIRTENDWLMDYDDMEAAFRDEGVKYMMICNPHNPIGRVWKKEELERALEIANRYNVIVICDEIHGEFTFARRLTRILTLEHTDNVVMLCSPTKAFNIAGLRQASVIIKNPELREKVSTRIGLCHAGTPNIFGATAQIAAYEYGDEWMDAVLEYIRENQKYAVEYIQKNIPRIKAYLPEGTYVLWLDCREMGLDDDALFRRFIDVGGVGMHRGIHFSDRGSGFMRLNVATQRATLIEALEGLKTAADL